MDSDDPTVDRGETRADYRHMFTPAAILIIGIVTAVVVRNALVPESFGEDGHYRADARLEAMALPTAHAGNAACDECHGYEYSTVTKDVHATVACETCHGVGAQHAETEDENLISTDRSTAGCLLCHQAMDARPGDFPQIDPAEHFKFVGASVIATCVECHQPHQPLYLENDVHKARMHPLIQECRNCHADRSIENEVMHDDHPEIFQCNYCHEAIATDFAQNAHTHVECTTCHLFIKETSYSGRIILNRNPKFCLLCHSGGVTHGADAAPEVKWPAHRDETAKTEADKSAKCMDCHAKEIHMTSERTGHEE